MKKLITIALVACSLSTFAQGVLKNGTIYKEHPYITAVNNLNAAFAKGDTTAALKFYADTAKFIDGPDASGKAYSLAKVRAGWQSLFSAWGPITIKQIGYPDGLEYATDPFTVQSWWLVTAVNKKTGKAATFSEVVFDTFNKDGKISFELSYYDTSAIAAAMK